jgi:alkylation response protein AidB-like acyl-CoA dehydrogenase
MVCVLTCCVMVQVRALTVFGYDDAPHGHLQINLEGVRIPASNILLGPGRGFEIAQGRLGPGRIHHCMRMIGLTERCLALMCERVLRREAFGRPLARFTNIQQDIARARIAIDQARLLTLHSAQLIDSKGVKAARTAVAMIKVVAPAMACDAIDRAMQSFGGAGLSQDTILAAAYAGARSLRIADGPDEVRDVGEESTGDGLT